MIDFDFDAVGFATYGARRATAPVPPEAVPSSATPLSTAAHAAATSAADLATSTATALAAAARPTLDAAAAALANQAAAVVDQAPATAAEAAVAAQTLWQRTPTWARVLGGLVALKVVISLLSPRRD